MLSLYIIRYLSVNQRQRGYLQFLKENKTPTPVTGEALRDVLWHASKWPRLIVLNTCKGGASVVQNTYAGVAQELIRSGVPAVVAMRCDITDEAAKEFSSAFYGALAKGEPVDAALQHAQYSIRELDSMASIEWGNAMLFMRGDDGRLFDIAEAQPAAPKELMHCLQNVAYYLKNQRERLNAGQAFLWTAEMALQAGDLTHADALFGKADMIAAESGNTLMQRQVNLGFAQIELKRERWPRAEKLMPKSIGDPLSITMLEVKEMFCLARAQYGLGTAESAMETYNALADACEKRMLLILENQYVVDNQWELHEALEYAEEAKQVWSEIGNILILEKGKPRRSKRDEDRWEEIVKTYESVNSPEQNILKLNSIITNDIKRFLRA